MAFSCVRFCFFVLSHLKPTLPSSRPAFLQLTARQLFIAVGCRCQPVPQLLSPHGCMSLCCLLCLHFCSPEVLQAWYKTSGLLLVMAVGCDRVHGYPGCVGSGEQAWDFHPAALSVPFPSSYDALHTGGLFGAFLMPSS